MLRLTGKDTHLLGIDREVERAANQQAAALGIAPEVYAFLEPEGYLVTRFVTGTAIPMEQMRTPATLARLAPELRAFHDSPTIAGVFDCFRVPESYVRTATARGVRVPDAYDRAEAAAARIEAAFGASPEPNVPCHNDLLNANFLLDAVDGDHVWLLDWEYAGMNTRWFDLGNFATNNDLDTDGEHALVAAYFGQVTERRQARLALMKVMSDLREAMWGVVQQGHEHPRLRLRRLRGHPLRPAAGERERARVRGPARRRRRSRDDNSRDDQSRDARSRDSRLEVTTGA